CLHSGVSELGISVGIRSIVRCDDCISIKTGCTNVYVHDVNSDLGHGISIGSLRKDGTTACVSNINVRNVKMHNTMTGLRIKTWQGGSGYHMYDPFCWQAFGELYTPTVPQIGCLQQGTPSSSWDPVETGCPA
ncbi:pectin lyase-like superfamily protein, partial [Tanacetum coccineum]